MFVGKIYDCIILGVILVVMAIIFIGIGSVWLILLMAIVFGFSGLMFGLDLDIYFC